jgi:hypothetical protein
MILTDALILYCKKHKLGPRALAKETGIIPMNASRFLQGKAIPHDSFMKVFAWAMKPPKEANQSLPKNDVPPAS